MIHESSVVLSNIIGEGVDIAPFVYIARNVVIGKNVKIHPQVVIDEGVEIGERCIIGRNVTINYATKLEDRVKVMDLTHITAHTVIRKNAFVAPGVFSADDNRFGKQPDQSNTLIGGAEIGENANIGVGATLLPKVKIGKNAVVGAGAVVTHDVEEDSLVLGIPARKQN